MMAENETSFEHLSQTAQDYINAQLELENQAREVLPYAFDKCTKEMGPIRQLVFACLTCTPDGTTPAGICYSCSISCHGSHGELVELFSKRNFVCDCGTDRFTDTFCTLRKCKNEEPASTNHYSQNFRGRFCQDELYDAEVETGTMYQCLLGDVCGEDWYHDACIVGRPKDTSQPKALESKTHTELQINNTGDVTVEKLETTEAEAIPENEAKAETSSKTTKDLTQSAQLDNNHAAAESAAQTSALGLVDLANVDEENEDAKPEGFPSEDDFDSFICWKCIDANAWLKRYAGHSGFLGAVFREEGLSKLDTSMAQDAKRLSEKSEVSSTTSTSAAIAINSGTKRKLDDDIPADENAERLKRLNVTPITGITSDPPQQIPTNVCKAPPMPEDTNATISLFLKTDFRNHLCHCASCFPLLAKFTVLLEEEETYEPPLDDDANSAHESLFDAGERALNTMDRVKAIEGVMAYNTLKEKVRAFLQPFADQKKVVGEDDVKKYFEGLINQEN